jgi:hypothetical protein
MPDDVIADLVSAVGGTAAIELGDPGTTIDGDTPRTELPPYEGPPEPAADHRHEWGEEMDQRPDEAPLGGPRLAGSIE